MDKEEKEMSYTTLEDTVNLSKGDVRLALNDPNAKIERKECYKIDYWKT